MALEHNLVCCRLLLFHLQFWVPTVRCPTQMARTRNSNRPQSFWHRIAIRQSRPEDNRPSTQDYSPLFESEWAELVSTLSVVTSNAESFRERYLSHALVSGCSHCRVNDVRSIRRRRGRGRVSLEAVRLRNDFKHRQVMRLRPSCRCNQN